MRITKRWIADKTLPVYNLAYEESFRMSKEQFVQYCDDKCIDCGLCYFIDIMFQKDIRIYSFINQRKQCNAIGEKQLGDYVKYWGPCVYHLYHKNPDVTKEELQNCLKLRIEILETWNK